MAEYIEREAAIALASGWCHPANVAKEIAQLPAADVRPVVRGKWTKCTIALPLSDSCKTAYKCSNCSTHWDYTSPFCPFCGADMRGEDAT